MSACVALLFAACAGAPPPKIDPASATPAAPDPDRVPFGPDLRAAELRTLAATIRDNYSHLADKQRQWGLDLDALVGKYEPQVRAADTWGRYELAMVAFVSELHDAHLDWRRTRGAAEKKRRIVRLGLSTRWVGDELVVSEVWPGSGAERAGVRLGDRVAAVDGIDMAKRFEAWAAVRSWSRREDARFDFATDWPATRADVDKPPPAREVVRLRDDGAREPLAIVPETERPAWRKRDPVSVEPQGGATLLAVRDLRKLESEPAIAAVVQPLFVDARPLVIDLRDNGGGYDHAARELASRLFAHEVVGGELRVRLTPQSRAGHPSYSKLDEDPERPGWSRPQPVSAKPKAPRDYPAPIAALVGPGCRSACETLALLLRAGGARLFGETTGGSSGAPVDYTMPWSRARVSVPSWSMVDRAGRPIEGEGVAPDEVIAPSRDDLIAGRDPALARAIAWATGGRQRAVVPSESSAAIVR